MDESVLIIYTPLRSEVELPTIEENPEKYMKVEQLKETNAEKFITFLEESIRPLVKSWYPPKHIRNPTLRRKVSEILSSESQEIKQIILRDILFDFLKHGTATSMRAEGKYVIAITYSNVLYLLHSKLKEESAVMENSGQVNVYERFLDRDNIYRFVVFQKESEQLKIGVYLKHSSNKTFLSWLGIPEKKWPLPEEFTVRFVGKYGDYEISIGINNALIFELERNLQGGTAKVGDVELNLEQKVLKIKGLPLRIEYASIPAVHRRFSNKKLPQLFEYIKEYQYGIDYQREYVANVINELMNLNSFLDPKSFTLKPLIERADGLYRRVPLDDGYDEVLLLEKPEFEDFNSILIYAAKRVYQRFIEIDGEFLDEISKRIIEDEPTNILFVKKNVNLRSPIRIGNLAIYNPIPDKDFMDVLKSIDWNSLSPTYKILLKLSVLNLLTTLEPDFWIFDEVFEYIEKYVKPLELGEIPEMENILEYKAATILYEDYSRLTPKSAENIVSELKEDILKKLNDSYFKFYVIGIDESTRKVQPIKKSNFGDDKFFKEIYRPLKIELERNGIIITEPKKIMAADGFLIIFSVKWKDPSMKEKQIAEGFKSLATPP